MKPMHLSFWLLILFSVTINASLMEYKAKDDNASIYGTLNIQCAPEVADILTQWVVKFQSLYPNVQSKLGFKSSTYSIKSVIQGQANIGLARRQIVQKEVD
ncbi:MAG: hypothetical protein U9N49_02720, partial [Campylobacterota bacterium]|nr:hypothetical protein [Campylobacterota bacterium]